MLIGVVLASLPIPVRGIVTQLLGQQQDTLYALVSGAPMTPATAAQVATEESVFNIAVTNIDDTTSACAQRTCT